MDGQDRVPELSRERRWELVLLNLCLAEENIRRRLQGRALELVVVVEPWEKESHAPTRQPRRLTVLGHHD